MPIQKLFFRDYNAEKYPWKMMKSLLLNCKIFCLLHVFVTSVSQPHLRWWVQKMCAYWPIHQYQTSLLPNINISPKNLSGFSYMYGICAISHSTPRALTSLDLLDLQRKSNQVMMYSFWPKPVHISFFAHGNVIYSIYSKVWFLTYIRIHSVAHTISIRLNFYI